MEFVAIQGPVCKMAGCKSIHAFARWPCYILVFYVWVGVLHSCILCLGGCVTFLYFMSGWACVCISFS